jgi:hypothetical protein
MSARCFGLAGRWVVALHLARGSVATTRRHFFQSEAVKADGRNNRLAFFDCLQRVVVQCLPNQTSKARTKSRRGEELNRLCCAEIPSRSGTIKVKQVQLDDLAQASNRARLVQRQTFAIYNRRQLIFLDGGTMRIITVAFFTLAFSSSATLAWEASVDGPDVFNKTTVISMEDNYNHSLIVQCDSESVLLLAFLEKKKEFEPVSEGPAKLYLKWADGGPIVLDATIREWNSNYLGVVVSGRENSVLKAVEGIRDAKAKIQAGIEILGNKTSATFGSHGSQKAMKTVIEKCNLPKATP